MTLPKHEYVLNVHRQKKLIRDTTRQKSWYSIKLQTSTEQHHSEASFSVIKPKKKNEHRANQQPRQAKKGKQSPGGIVPIGNICPTTLGIPPHQNSLSTREKWGNGTATTIRCNQTNHRTDHRINSKNRKMLQREKKRGI